MKTKFFIFFSFFLLATCSSILLLSFQNNIVSCTSQNIIPKKDYSSSFSLVFASCNEHLNDQSYWTTLLDHNNKNKNNKNFIYDALIWLGDIVYIDIAPWVPYLPHHYERDEESAAEIWDHMKNKNPQYKEFVSKTRHVVGIRDDHEHLNDMGKAEGRKSSQGKLLDFLDVPPASPDNREATVRRLERDGDYAFHKMPFAGFENDKEALPVCVVFLDFRSGRDHPIPNENGSTVMSDKQWKWFSHVLKTGKDVEIDSNPAADEGVKSIDDVCAVTFIGTGVQFIFDAAPMETWGEYRNERDKVLREIAKSTARRLVFLTGDVHYSEAGKLSHKPVTMKGDGILDEDPHHLPPMSKDSPLYERCPESIWPDQDLYEITSSGLTHHEQRELFDEPKYHRWFPSHRRLEPGVWIQKNVGLVDIACSDVRNGETCRVISKLYELPMMSEIMTVEPTFVPKSKQIKFGKEANDYFKEKYPHCPHLHDIGNTYKLPAYPGLWTQMLDWTMLHVPFCQKLCRLEAMFVHFYGFAVLVLILVIGVVIKSCGGGGKKKMSVEKKKKE